MAVLSDVGIANFALSNIGAASDIESLTEVSAEAVQCNLWYNHARKTALAAHDWSFARKRLTLSVHSEAADLVDWGVRYQYPADCLNFRRVVNPLGGLANPIPYAIEIDSAGASKTILTNLAEAKAVYTFDQQLITLFSDVFVGLFAAQLAALIAFSLTGKKSVRKEMQDLYSGLLAQVPALASNEEQSGPPREAEHIRARFQ